MNAGANAGARFELSKEEQNLLGRDWQCKVVLNDPQCSRVHAEIFRDEDGWWVRDNQSSNGTQVNGQTIDQARLVEGTEIRIGGSTFTFSESQKKEAVAIPGGENHQQTTGQLTIVLDKSMKADAGLSATLDFLKGQDWGQDFFFLLCVFPVRLSAPSKIKVESLATFTDPSS